MPGVTEQEIAQAKQMNLYQYMQLCEPDNFKPEGPGQFRHKGHSSLTFAEDGSWTYFKTKATGRTALNYAGQLRGQLNGSGNRASCIPVRPCQSCHGKFNRGQHTGLEPPGRSAIHLAGTRCTKHPVHDLHPFGHPGAGRRFPGFPECPPV